MKQTISADEIKSRIEHLVVDVLNVSGVEIDRETRLVEDLHADSVDRLSLVLAFEDEFSITLNDEELGEIVTVGQIIDLVMSSHAKLSEGTLDS